MELLKLFIVLMSILLVNGCGKKQEARNTATQTLPPINVKTATVGIKQRQAYEYVVGTVRSKTYSVIEAKVSGKIEILYVSPGQYVKKGEVLAKLDVREIQAKYEQAKAIYERATSDLRRYKTLLDAEAAAQSEYDAQIAQFKVAEAGLKEAQTMLSYAEVTAPFDGVITRKIADVGDLAYAGKPLLEIEDPKSLRFEANIPEALCDKIKLGEKYNIIISTIQDEIVGTVGEISPVADPNTRTILVKLDLAPHSGLRSGQFGRMKIPVNYNAAPRVPIQSVVVRGQMEIAFVVETNLARMRLVKTGERVDNEIEILSGIEAGEKVIIEPVNQLKDGQKVIEIYAD